MGSSIPAGKKGLRDYLQTTAGLRPADGVTVRSAEITPEEMTKDIVFFGTATATLGNADMAGRRAEAVTMQAWVRIIRPGSDETAIDIARDTAAGLMNLIAAALAADRTAAGTIIPPGQVNVASGGLEEFPADWEGSAARQATIPFTFSWTSHVT